MLKLPDQAKQTNNYWTLNKSIHVSAKEFYVQDLHKEISL